MCILVYDLIVNLNMEVNTCMYTRSHIYIGYNIVEHPHIYTCTFNLGF